MKTETKSEFESIRTDRMGPAVREAVSVAMAVLVYVSAVWLLFGQPALVWDEPPHIARQYAVRAWLAKVFGTPGERASAFSREGLDDGWPFAGPAPHEHPPLYALLSLATWRATDFVAGPGYPLLGHRLATILLLATTSSVMFRMIRVRWGAQSALVGVAALLFDPRIFAHAQLATLDFMVAGFSLLAAVAFLSGCETGRRPWLFGILAALTVMSKVTGVLLLPALLVWTVVYRPTNAWRQFAWAILVMPCVMIAIYPPWWIDPIAGPLGWARELLRHDQKVPVHYFGVVYDNRRAFLPWHNSLVYTAIMVPIGLLILAGIGLVDGVWKTATGNRRRSGEEAETRPTGRLPDHVVCGWAASVFLVWIGARMTPWMPAHDGLRQIVTAYVFMAVIAAYGAFRLVRPTPWGAKTGAEVSPPTPPRRWAAGIVVAACVGSAAWTTLRFHPYELSYYNELVGGPVGAKALGMETTYFWDSATDDVLAWIDENVPVGATLLIFPPRDVRVFHWLQDWGKLRRDLRFLNFDPKRMKQQLGLMVGPRPCYLVFQYRQGLFLPREPGTSDLFARLADAPAVFELAPERIGVRLLAIFDRDDFRRFVDDFRRFDDDSEADSPGQ